jgi:predicted transcriptional regulator
MNVTRARIYKLLVANPDGLTAVEIASALGAKRSTVAVALCKLINCGQIIRKSPPLTMVPYRYKRKPSTETHACR